MRMKLVTATFVVLFVAAVIGLGSFTSFQFSSFGDVDREAGIYCQWQVVEVDQQTFTSEQDLVDHLEEQRPEAVSQLDSYDFRTNTQGQLEFRPQEC